MIKTIEITNYKSIEDLTIELGQVTVLIGENGSGKSNILEAIGLVSAAAHENLSNEFLVPRGIRVTDPPFMRAGFDSNNMGKDIKISMKIYDSIFKFIFHNENSPYSTWSYLEWLDDNPVLDFQDIKTKLYEIDPQVVKQKLGIDFNRLMEIYHYLENAKSRLKNIPSHNMPKVVDDTENIGQLITEQKTITKKIKDTLGLHYRDFLIYAPENTALRNFHEEGQIQPLGVKGEGLFKLLSVMSREPEKGHMEEIKTYLQLFDWFEGFDLPNNLFPGERRLQIKDRYLDETMAYFDQRSANEGFLYLLFYFTLFISDYTPKFFAIDNIDASLNPKLCRRLMQELVTLAKKHGKQVIMTTHNPAILDGLDLTDEAQKLYVVYRNLMGQTKVRPVTPAQPPEGEAPIRLSEAFLKGYLGGLPQNF